MLQVDVASRKSFFTEKVMFEVECHVASTMLCCK